MNKKSLKNILYFWFVWVIIILGFQWITSTRFRFERPDFAVSWTNTETLLTSNKGKIYLLEPFMNRQVAWDSEYYIGIAVGGYDDPKAGREINPNTGNWVIKNYSFFPFYPFMMRLFALPLKLSGMNSIAAASLAGVIVASLGILAGMIALWDITHSYFEEEDANRTVFYALIFPTAFFFVMVYTEGLFIGLAFGALALSRRGHWAWASILAVFAAWTRAHGAVLSLPLIILWGMQINWWKPLKPQLTYMWRLRGILSFLPVLGYFLWRYSILGVSWAELQTFYYGRGFMPIGRSIADWIYAFNYARYMGGGDGQIYLAIEIGVILLAFISSLWFIKRDPAIALYSLAVVVLSVFSGSAGSMARYMLIVPTMYIFLAQLGKNKTFDKAWTTFSILLLGMEASLFAADMWVG